MAKNNGSGKGRGGLGRPSMRHKKHAIMIKTAHRKENIANHVNKSKCD